MSPQRPSAVLVCLCLQEGRLQELGRKEGEEEEVAEEKEAVWTARLAARRTRTAIQERQTILSPTPCPSAPTIPQAC
jgi:hypothetical protein